MASAIATAYGDNAKAKSFASTCALARSQNGSPLGHFIWCGPGDEQEIARQIQGLIAERDGVVVCSATTLLSTLMQTRFIVGVAVVNQSVPETIRLLTEVRSQAYARGIGCPVYAALVETRSEQEQLHGVCDVVSTELESCHTTLGLYDLINSKLQPDTAEKNVVVWCDPLFRSPIMKSKVESLERMGLSVHLCGDEDELMQNVTNDTFAVVVTARSSGAIAKIREKLADDSTRPLFWLVSLRFSVDDAYRLGADAAIVDSNEFLVHHKSHILSKQPSDSWMWTVVVGDIKSNVLSKGVNGVGGTLWSLPKQFDDRCWLSKEYPRFLQSGDDYFRQIAAQHGLRVQATDAPSLDDANLVEHMRKFEAARSNLSGYVFEKLLYHGTSVACARSILREGFKPSHQGMYGPGVYAVDVTGMSKALFFAFFRKGPDDDEDDRTLDDSKSGAVIAIRVGFRSPVPVAELRTVKDGGRTSPCEDGDDAVIGTACVGYSKQHDCWSEKKHGRLNDIPEYVIRDADLAMPLGMAIYTL